MGVMSEGGRRAAGKGERVYCPKAAERQPVDVEGSIVRRRPEGSQ